MTRSRLRPSPLTVALAVAAIAICVAAALAVGRDAPASTAASEQLVTVRNGVVQATVSGSGNLEPANQVALSFGASGDVEKIYVKEGEHVSEGELLARIDDGEAKVTLAQAQADLASAEDQLESASSSSTDTTSATTTSADADETASDSTSSATSTESAQAAVDSAQLAVDQAEEALAATRIHAPMPGTISAIDGSEGDSVSATGSSSGGEDDATSDTSTSSSFITLSQLSRMKLEVGLGEADIGKVKVGQQATVTVNAASGEQLAGKVTAIGVLSSSSSTDTGTATATDSSAVSYPVTIALTQSTDGLKAGMTASADIVTSETEGLSVPTAAISGGSVTVDQDGRRTTKAVQTGLAGDSATIITSGLKAGEQVVVTSASAAAGAAAAGTSATDQDAGAQRGAGLGGGGAGGFTPPAGAFGGGTPPGGAGP